MAAAPGLKANGDSPLQQRLVVIDASFAGMYAALSAADDLAEVLSAVQGNCAGNNAAADLLAFIQA